MPPISSLQAFSSAKASAIFPLASRGCDRLASPARSRSHPMAGTSINSGIDPMTGQLGPMLTRNVDTLHWGFAIEFSTLYLTDRFTPGKLPKEEPLNQLVPLVEFSFVSPRGEKTVATMTPGLSYVAVSWQVAAEAIVPLN